MSITSLLERYNKSLLAASSGEVGKVATKWVVSNRKVAESEMKLFSKQVSCCCWSNELLGRSYHIVPTSPYHRL